jgi:tRNA threonylcarbamoyladenosine biosynthesis protein TsaE
VAAAVTSPTFVIARVHRDGRIPLVHVDAFRLGAAVDVDDLDLDASVEESATVVEWGEGLVEGLSSDRLEIRIDRPATDTDETRTVTMRAVGERWAALLDAAGPLAPQ